MKSQRISFLHRRKIFPCIIFFVICCLREGSFQEDSDIFERLGSTIAGTFTFLRKGARFVAEDMFNAISNELDDMTPQDLDDYDFIVVGAGSAGAAVASRLSEIPSVSVLIIEAGIEESYFMDIPLSGLYLQLTEDINWNYKMERSPDYCRAMLNNQCNMPRGKVMGGCSVLNLMIATRCNREDYDSWARMGCEGWSYDDVLPIFKKMENFQVDDPVVEPQYHGTGGLLNIARASYHTSCAEAFLRAGEELGFSVIDYDGDSQIGYAYTYGTVKNGSRCSSNRAYLHPAKGRPNLFLTRQSRADKLLISPNTNRVYGVLFTKNGQSIRVRAKKEVIVCAGAINSPKLLMLSGIGPASQLRQFGIPVLKDAPVGENLMDHMSYWGLNFLVNESVTVLSTEVMNLNNNMLNQYLAYRVGPLSVTGGIEAANFINVDDLNTRTGTTNMELMLTGISLGSDQYVHQALSIVGEHYEEYLKDMVGKHSFMIVPVLLSPKSKGWVRLRSSNPDDKPRIFPNYFSHPDDMRRMILGIRESIRITKTKAMKKYSPRLPDKPIPGCNFPHGSDEYWDCAVRTFGDTLYHPSGTCKMGAANDPTAVVDPRLRVIGITGLRVADASIMPEVVVGHPNVPTMMIGEKLAKMVREDWGLIPSN